MVELLLDSARGIYIPRDFARECDNWHIDPLDRDVLLAGPDHDLYWETWDMVLSYAYIDAYGHRWYLYQDGDLFAVTEDDTSMWEN